MAKKTTAAFFEAGSWYHRVKIMQDDGTTKYSKKGGFKTAKEAEASYRRYDAEYREACRAHLSSSPANYSLRDYLIFWFEEIYSSRIESTSRMVGAYVLYCLILPAMRQDVKLCNVSVDYMDALLKEVSKSCESAGNKGREFLCAAFRDAAMQGYIARNPMPETKPYKRRKANIVVLNKERLRFFLEKASLSPWYLEILLGLFMGLRKGEISGLKFSDFDMENRTVHICRQVTSNPVVKKGEFQISEYQVIEKHPKTPNSCRTMRVPEAVMEEVIRRKNETDLKKERFGDAYVDSDYVSCRDNGLPHAVASFNGALSKLCSRNGLPHLTVHSLRHMYATILTEQGVSLAKVSALLGHSSVHTTFEYYCEVMDEEERILGFMNDAFAPEEA